MTETATESPLLRMTQTTPTVLWNDSATLSELEAAIGWGAVGATEVNGTWHERPQVGSAGTRC